MMDHSEEYVALFIDWDNLAISIAADLSGATPDVKRLVQTAQNYGTILVARAYAEWNSTSERLNVYRYGVEPVYAPTFRFEADPITQAARGKSLADPCMVADCVDTLHLHPRITTLVIVSGDKDLIPVVRLAQLRGKHVVVIGPDYSAGVLREISDEFISYRSVVEGTNGKQAEPVAPEIGARASRRQTPVRMPQPPQPSVAQRRSRPTPVPQPSSRSKPFVEQAETANQTAAELIDASKPDYLVEGKDISYDLSAVIATMVDIVKQRTGEGKERLRATNLKDALMVKLPGFSEKKFGFAKFKDFLIAAEKTGVISLSVAGPVHWVSLPQPKTELSPEALQRLRDIAAAEPPAATGAPLEPQATGEPLDVINLPEDRYSDIVKFVVDLKSRSKWLTYTYVLTNLISFLGKLLPEAEADSAARATLNRMVQEGILRIDREPQEVEVGGIRHRVRMCHLEEQHPFVAEAMAAIEQLRRQTEIEATLQAPKEEPATEAPQQGKEPAQELGPSPESRTTEDNAGFSGDIAPQTEAAQHEESAHAAEHSLTEHTTTHQEQENEPATQSSTPWHRNREDEETGAVTVATEELTPQPLEAAELSHGETLPPDTKEGREEDHPAGAAEHGDETRGEIVGLSVPLSLEEAFDAVERVVRESASSGKARVRLTGLKAKLTGELEHFDEQIYGFKRFKDFLLAAERADRVKLEAAGPVVWVTLSDRRQKPAEAASPAADLPNEANLVQETAPEGRNGGRKPRSTRRRSQSKTREAIVER